MKNKANRAIDMLAFDDDAELYTFEGRIVQLSICAHSVVKIIHYGGMCEWVSRGYFETYAKEV